MGEFKPYPKQGPKPKKEKKPLKRTAIKKKFKPKAAMILDVVLINSMCLITGLLFLSNTTKIFMSPN